MKNRLEEEYRQLKQSEVPDLWERIKAGIDAGINAEVETETDARIEAGINAEVDDKADGTDNGKVEVEIGEELRSEQVEVINELSKGKNKKNRKAESSFRKYSLPLVACIAALLCVPLMLTGFLRILSGSSASYKAEEAAPAENYATTAEASDELLPEAYEEEACEEAVCEDAAAEEVMAEQEAADSVCSQETADAANDTGNSGAAEDEMKQESDKEQAIQELAQKLDENQVIITITGFSAEEGLLEEGRSVGTTYFVTTVEQGECSVFVPSDAVFLVELDQSVRIVVEPGDGSYDYLFVRMAD